MLGIINLNKPAGNTSHDMVTFVRRLLQTKRVGHAGTLDPEASGVLPILVGKATLLSDLLTEKTKGYIARVRLGVETDTYDLTGTVTNRCDIRPDEAEIMTAVQGFLGPISQLPPMYSAVKMNGRKLYELARQGVTVERAERQVEIFSLRAYDFCGDEFSLEVSCSKGTYIRSLCHDLGKALGTCACMSSLVRTRSGPFCLEEAHTPEELTLAAEAGMLEPLILPLETVLSHYPAVSVSEEMASKVKNGLRMRTEQFSIATAQAGDRFRIYQGDSILCLARAVGSDHGLVLAIEKNFCKASV